MTQTQNSSMKEKLLDHINELGNFKNDEDFDEVLENLKALLISASYRDVQEVASQLNLTQLFHQFNVVFAERKSDILMKVFTMFLEALSVSEIFTKYHENILEGLRSSNDLIVELWLKKVIRPLFINDGLLKNIAINQTNLTIMLCEIIKLLTSDKTSSASLAHDVCVSASKAFRQDFFSPIVLEELKNLKNLKGLKIDGETLMIRYYELCVDIACVNQLLLDMIKENGFLKNLDQDFENKLSTDLLSAVNMCKIITDLASKLHGLEFLKNNTSIFPSIAHKIKSSSEDDQLFSKLVLPGFINLFIRVAEFDLEILNQYPIVLNKLLEFCEKKQSDNIEFVILAIDSVGYLCHKSEGKLFLADQMKTYLDTIVWMINSGQTDIQSRALHALNEIMEVFGADTGNKASELTQTWYEHLQQKDCGLSRFMQLAREPFLDIRLPAILFMRVLATTIWGQKVLAADSDSFLDYLADRNTETCKEGREAKFEIVRELAMSPFVRLSFSPESYLRIRAEFKNSTITSKEVNVAFENA